MKRGFTLTEVMVAVVLFMVVGGGLLTLFLTGNTSSLSSDAYVQVQQEARKAFDNSIQELRAAGNVVVSADAKQLHFQIARGYNTEAACQNPPAICWGSDVATGQWVHVAITGAGDGVQLARCVTQALVNPVTDFTGCRILANRVKGGTSSFVYDAANRVVTMTMEFEYRNAALPGGRQTTTPLTTRIKLRNP